MIDFKEVKKYITENYEEVSAALESERLSIAHAPEIKILHSKFLNEFWNERPNKLLTYVIFFQEEIIPELDFYSIKAHLYNEVTEALKTHKIIEVDNGFNVKLKSAEAINKELVIALSGKRNVAFFFGEEGIEIAVRGKLIDNINFFYNESDRLQFLKKYHISNLQECLKDYEVFIKEPGINEAFFASNMLVARIKPENTPKNTLNNKPENILRNNLLTYLNRNTQHLFSKENELNNRRELDLYTEVEGKVYLIEVKWLGQAVNDDETGFTHNVTDYAARNGVTQTLEYIKQLFEEMNFNLHCGYLCVFDAREEKNPINYQDFDFVTTDLMPYYKKHFIKLDEICLNRNS